MYSKLRILWPSFNETTDIPQYLNAIARRFQLLISPHRYLKIYFNISSLNFYSIAIGNNHSLRIRNIDTYLFTIVTS